MKKSQFHGSVGEFIGTAIIASLMITFTLGIATPWAMVKMIKYVFKNSTIEGKQLEFVGTGGSLIGNWIVWSLLTLIRFGIYGLWVPNKIYTWVVENTQFKNSAAEAEVVSE